MIIEKNPSLLNKIKSAIDTNAINMNVADMLMAAFNYVDLIDEQEVKQYIKEGLNETEAILEILYDFYGLKHNKENDEVMDYYFLNNLKQLDSSKYSNNPYSKAINKEGRLGKYALKYLTYEPYQLFAYDDIKIDGYKENSQIGYFDKKFSYLALCESNNIWMSLNPNEIETMKPFIDKGKGHVLVLGLGMGYVPFMLSLKDEVTSITVIEKDPEIIALFNKLIYPNFNKKEKIKIIQDDAFNYLSKKQKEAQFDYIFADLWHDPEDGLELFVKLKRINQNIDCWLDVSMYALLRRCMITLLEEQLDNYQDDAYRFAKTYTDKVINLYYQKTKNLHLTKDEDIDNLLSDNYLLSLVTASK